MRTLLAVAVAVAVALVFAASAVCAQSQTLIERGGYLVNTVMACHSCHTPIGPNGPDFSRALSGGRTFDEPAFKVTGSNITPDKETGIGGWSDAELKAFLITGVRPNGVPVAPIMPNIFYTALTARDLDALVAYLRSVPAVHHETPAPEYRIKARPEKAPYAGAAMSEAELADPIKHGRYLATIAHCLECHTPVAAGGGHDFAKSSGRGGTVFKGPFGQSVAANITSHVTSGLGGWTDDEIKRALTQGIARDGHRLKPPMAFAAYAKLTPQDQDALVAFLRTLPALD
jgi:mono/diheme cytochrome c family protein